MQKSEPHSREVIPAVAEIFSRGVLRLFLSGSFDVAEHEPEILQKQLDIIPKTRIHSPRKINKGERV